jgi:hypothetical protein
VGAELSHASLTDGHETNSRFSKLCERAQNTGAEVTSSKKRSGKGQEHKNWKWKRIRTATQVTTGCALNALQWTNGWFRPDLARISPSAAWTDKNHCRGQTKGKGAERHVIRQAAWRFPDLRYNLQQPPCKTTAPNETPGTKYCGRLTMMWRYALRLHGYAIVSVRTDVSE